MLNLDRDVVSNQHHEWTVRLTPLAVLMRIRIRDNRPLTRYTPVHRHSPHPNAVNVGHVLELRIACDHGREFHGMRWPPQRPPMGVVRGGPPSVHWNWMGFPTPPRAAIYQAQG